MISSKRIIYEILKRQKKSNINLIDENFTYQANYIRDPSKLKALFCTRRSAKSYTGGLHLAIDANENPGVSCLYIGLTRESAKRIMWKDIFKEINKKHKLNIKFNESNLTGTLPNGSIIYLMGMDSSEDEKDKALGQKYKCVVIDEAASFTIDLHELVYGILGPAMADLRGTICMMGTSGNIVKGLFYDITIGKEPGWSVHKWTAHDNPYIAKQWQEELDEIKANRPLFMETSLFKQWYLNQWVIDDEKKVYKYIDGKNDYEILPHYIKGEWIYLLGVDLGYDDDSAFTIGAYHIHDKCLYFVNVFKQKKMDVTDVANRIKYYQSQYEITKVIIDGANKQAVQEIQNRHGIILMPADKIGKVDFIEIMNAEFIQGNIKLSDKCNDLKEEYKALIWDDRSIKKQEHPSCANHLCFVAGTMIMTPNGEIPIEKLNIGDYVQTRKGARRVKCAINRESNVITLNLSNGTNLTCTSDHPFWSNGKWIKAESLTKMDLLLTWGEHQSRKKYYSKMLNIIGILGIYISKVLGKRKPFIYIEKYGFIIKALSQKNIRYITKTITHWIIEFQTWHVYQFKTIKRNMLILLENVQIQKRISNYWPKYALLLKYGTLQKKDMSGINNMQKKALKKERWLWPYVVGARRSIQNHSPLKRKKDVVHRPVFLIKEKQAALMILKKIAYIAKKYISLINMPKSKHVVFVVPNLTGTQKNIQRCNVYNITVDDQHEYFANKILVSNCDAALYMWRYAYQYMSTKLAIKIRPGSPEWFLEQERLMIENTEKGKDKNWGF